MTKVGETELARNIGKSGTNRYIWVACPICGYERWVSHRFFTKGKYQNRGMCNVCSHAKAEQQGWIDDRGYKIIRLPKKDFFYSMTARDGDKTDNRIENLVLTTSGEHQHRWHNKEIQSLKEKVGMLEMLKRRVDLLENEIKTLRT